ncbi:MAG: hypothetical protein GX166_13055 [Clostridiaceae bacterium]|nr:hypothetical protein [Clostridiaceae bacterium]
MKRKIVLVVLMSLVLMVILSGCIPGDGKHNEENKAGFFWGVWHGWIAPISLIGGIFNKDLRVYEVANTGWWYDFGFYIAIISGFGGLSLTRRNTKND